MVLRDQGGCTFLMVAISICLTAPGQITNLLRYLKKVTDARILPKKEILHHSKANVLFLYLFSQKMLIHQSLSNRLLTGLWSLFKQESKITVFFTWVLQYTGFWRYIGSAFEPKSGSCFVWTLHAPEAPAWVPFSL